MSRVRETNHIIAELLKEGIPLTNNIGLCNGKMGICIYFYHLARETGDTDFEKLAEKLIDEVYEKVSNNQYPADFENGLSGIAWGIEHLVQHNFVEADTDVALSQVDDKIYRHLGGIKKLPIGITKGAIGFALYILFRLEGKDIHSEDPDIFVYKRMLIQLINRIGTLVEERKLRLQEPLLFDLTWDLPLTLILLAKIRGMSFYNSKIDRILECLSPVLLSLYPRSPSNRLYLVFGLQSVLQQIHIEDWDRHAGLLKEDIHLANILKDDLKNKSICFVDGVAGISFIHRQLFSFSNDEKLQCKSSDLIEKITTSEYWQVIKEREPEKRNLGLFSGLAGIGMELLKLSKEQPIDIHRV
jgi:hypothetical protein